LPTGLSCSQTDAFAVNGRLKTLARALAFRNILSVALILCPRFGEVEAIHLEDSRHIAQVPAPGGSPATRRLDLDAAKDRSPDTAFPEATHI